MTVNVYRSSIRKIGGDARTPRRGSAQAAGYNVYSAVTKEIPPEKTVFFPSNIITKPEPGWCLKLYNRSGLAANHLVCILGGPMVIDSDYRGIVMVPQLFEGKTLSSEKGGLNCTGVDRKVLQNILGS